MIDLVMLAQAAEATTKATGWDVALRALEVLGPALVALALSGAAWLKVRAQRDAVIRGVEEAGHEGTKRAIQAHAEAEGVDLDGAIKAATKRLKGGDA